MKNASNNMGAVSIDKSTMLQLLGNMDNLTTTVQQLKEDYGKVCGVLFVILDHFIATDMHKMMFMMQHKSAICI